MKDRIINRKSKVEIRNNKKWFYKNMKYVSTIGVLFAKLEQCQKEIPHMYAFGMTKPQFFSTQKSEYLSYIPMGISPARRNAPAFDFS